jgi:hypothetical protein
MKGALRGLVVVVAIAFGPVFLARAGIPLAATFGAGDLANLCFGVMLFWAALALPYLGLSSVVMGQSTAYAVALVQWSVVGLLVGHLTSKRGLGRTLLAGLASVLFFGPATHLALRALGYQVIFEGP